MDLLDIGCGNCSWINYCKNKGINTTGLTITQSQADFCKSKGINNIIIGDIHKNVLKTINKKFDAITNIGAMEHFTSISLPPQKQVQKIKLNSPTTRCIKIEFHMSKIPCLQSFELIICFPAELITC